MLIHYTLIRAGVFVFVFFFFFGMDKMHFTPFKFEIDFNLASQLSKLTIYAIEYHNNVNAGLLFCHISAFNPFKTASLEKKNENNF